MKTYKLIAFITLHFLFCEAETKPTNDNAKTFSSEVGFYKVADNSNSCSNDDMNALSVCTSEILSSLDNCKPNDLNCVCCSLQNLDSACFDLCSEYSSNNILSSITKDCEQLADIDTCELYSKSKNQPMKKILTPKKSLVEEEEPKTVIKSVFSSNNNIEVINEEPNEVDESAIDDVEKKLNPLEKNSTSNVSIKTEKESGSEGLFTSAKSLCLGILIILVSII